MGVAGVQASVTARRPPWRVHDNFNAYRGLSVKSYPDHHCWLSFVGIHAWSAKGYFSSIMSMGLYKSGYYDKKVCNDFLSIN